MNLNPFIITLIVSFALIMWARMVSNNSIKTLSTEEKAGLVDLFAPLRKLSLIVAGVALGLYLLNFMFKLIEIETALFGFLVILGLFFAYINYQSFTILKQNTYPEKYIKQYLLSSVLRLSGIALMLFGFIYFGY